MSEKPISTLQSRVDSIRHLLGQNDKYIVPEFSRPYMWNAAQAKQLWDDILNAFIDQQDFYFWGAFIINRGGFQQENTSVIYLFDGQQRLTTITLLLTAIRDYALKIGDENFADYVNGRCLIRRSILGSSSLQTRLTLTKADQTTYHAIVLHENTSLLEKDKSLLKVFNLLSKQVLALIENTPSSSDTTSKLYGSCSE